MALFSFHNKEGVSVPWAHPQVTMYITDYKYVSFIVAISYPLEIVAMSPFSLQRLSTWEFQREFLLSRDLYYTSVWRC